MEEAPIKQNSGAGLDGDFGTRLSAAFDAGGSKADQSGRLEALKAEAWVKAMDIEGDLQAVRREMVEWILRLGQ